MLVCFVVFVFGYVVGGVGYGFDFVVRIEYGEDDVVIDVVVEGFVEGDVVLYWVFGGMYLFDFVVVYFGVLGFVVELEVVFVDGFILGFVLYL